jgi:hypothetical protein
VRHSSITRVGRRSHLLFLSKSSHSDVCAVRNNELHIMSREAKTVERRKKERSEEARSEEDINRVGALCEV